MKVFFLGTFIQEKEKSILPLSVVLLLRLAMKGANDIACVHCGDVLVNQGNANYDDMEYSDWLPAGIINA